MAAMGGKADARSSHINQMTNAATMLQFDWEAVEGATVAALAAKEARGLKSRPKLLMS
jgi:hypothetical protein